MLESNGGNVFVMQGDANVCLFTGEAALATPAVEAMETLVLVQRMCFFFSCHIL